MSKTNFRSETAKYFRILDFEGREYYVAAKDGAVFERFLRGRAWKDPSLENISMARWMRFDLGSLVEVSQSDARFSELYWPFVNSGEIYQDFCMLGYNVNPQENLLIARQKSQLLKV